jgi:hypothetical protein
MIVMRPLGRLRAAAQRVAGGCQQHQRPLIVKKREITSYFVSATLLPFARVLFSFIAWRFTSGSTDLAGSQLGSFRQLSLKGVFYH